jgi:hypothetical protein
LCVVSALFDANVPGGFCYRPDFIPLEEGQAAPAQRCTLQEPMSGRFVLACLLLTAMAAGCSSGSADDPPPMHSGPTAPPPGPVEPSVNVAGSWVGTLETNLGSQPISMTVVQLANCVDGTWISSGQDSRGAISGFAATSSFTGQISLERGRCSAIGTVTGEVGADTLRWTGSDMKPIGPCSDPLPQSIVVTMRRQ